MYLPAGRGAKLELFPQTEAETSHLIFPSPTTPAVLCSSCLGLAREHFFPCKSIRNLTELNQTLCTSSKSAKNVAKVLNFFFRTDFPQGKVTSLPQQMLDFHRRLEMSELFRHSLERREL